MDVGQEFLDRKGQQSLLHAGIRFVETGPQVIPLRLEVVLGAAHPHAGPGNDHAADEGFPVVDFLLFQVADGGIFRIQVLEQLLVILHGGVFLGTAPLHDVETVDALDLSLLEFSHIAEAEEGVRVLAADFRVPGCKDRDRQGRQKDDEE